MILLTSKISKSRDELWRFVTGLWATLNMPLKS